MAHGGSGSERWLLTYSDLITLLLAFFIILYAMSKLDSEKYQQVAEGLAIALGTYNPPASGSGGTSLIKPLTEDEQFGAVVEEVQEYLTAKGESQAVSMQIEERGLVISINANVFFATGEAELTPQVKDLLGSVAGSLRNIPNQIRVEGHTDNVPINSAKYPSNWQLSTDRATNVLIYLIQQYHLDPTKLSAAGYGEYHPVASNNTPQGRAKNRRVDLVVLRSKYAASEPGANGTASN